MLVKKVKGMAEEIAGLVAKAEAGDLDGAGWGQLRRLAASAKDLVRDVRGETLDDKVSDVVETFLRDGVAFTAWNVTEALRELEPGIAHHQVREVVHRLMGSGSLAITANYVAGVYEVQPGVEAILYHPAAFDSSLYQGKPVSLADATSLADDMDDDDEDVQPDDDWDDGLDDEDEEEEDDVQDMRRYFSKDGQLYIPKLFSSSIAGGAWAKMQDDKIVISGTGDVPLTRDAKGNIRLTRNKIKSLSDDHDWQSADCCVIELVPSGIIVRPL
jgi:hypothetical protein